MGKFLSPFRAAYAMFMGAVLTLFSALFSAAHAALDAGIGTAITAAKDDLLAALGLVIVAMVAVWGLRKLGRKMGWL